ncbi:hypothetical protein IW262DRAFT_1383683, partial [Armillaria fumosa]
MEMMHSKKTLWVLSTIMILLYLRLTSFMWKSIDGCVEDVVVVVVVEMEEVIVDVVEAAVVVIRILTVSASRYIASRMIRILPNRKPGASRS